MRARAIIVVEGEMHRIDAIHVDVVLPDGVGLADAVGRVGVQFLFQRLEEGREDVDLEAGGFGDDVADVLVDDGVDDDRALAVIGMRALDGLDQCRRLFGRIDVGLGHHADVGILELGEQTASQCLGGDAGAIGNEEGGSGHDGHS